MADGAGKLCGFEPGDRRDCACVMLFGGRLHNWPIVTVAVATAAQKQSLFFFYLSVRC